MDSFSSSSSSPASNPDPASPERIRIGHLPRLEKGAYLGNAVVHWTLTVRDRGTGWLTARFTTRFRWLLLHGCARYSVACPVHCLMPDHVHLLIHGWDGGGDQRRFIRFLRQHAGKLLAETGHRWQPQAHDHVLRPHESDRFAYQRLVRYIAENPVRTGLAASPSDWPHTGTVIPGYPELNLWQPDFWPRYGDCGSRKTPRRRIRQNAILTRMKSTSSLSKSGDFAYTATPAFREVYQAYCWP